MYQLLTKPQDDLGSDLDVRCYPIDGGRKRKQVRFQNRWLQQYSWLRYGNSEGRDVGGWCVFYLLFVFESEKATLGPFVNSPFINYNKSKEVCEKHAKSRLHLLANDRAYSFKSTYSNPD